MASSRKTSGAIASIVLLLTAIMQNGAAGSISNNFDGCEEVFVGAGWAGVYSFYRRILDDPDRGPKACLFEESWRIGGRTYSVYINHTTPNFVQDVGAYRFSPDMHLPGDLIMKDLGIVTECYASDCPDATTEMPEQFLFNYSAPLRRAIDPETKLPAGYVTPIERMIEIAKEFGGRVFTQTPLVGWTVTPSGDTDSALLLEFEDRQSNASSAIDKTQIIIDSPSVVVLNLPRNKLFEIQGVETSLEPDMVKILKCIAFDAPPDLFDGLDMLDGGDGVLTLEKAYVYYSDAWWRTVLNRNEGFWPNEEFGATPTKEGVLFNVRFHDGPVSCTDAGDKECNGILQIYYSVSNETVYSSTVRDHPEEPLGSVWDTDGPAAVEKLNQIHEGLLDLMSPLFEEMGVGDPLGTIAPPSGLLVGVWNRPSLDHPLGYGYTAPTKVYYEPSMSGTPDEVCGVRNLTDAKYRDRALQPWGETVGKGSSVFLVNNDWVCQNVHYFFGDWAEESLLQAERAMYLLHTPKPTWLDESYYEEKVISQIGDDTTLDTVSTRSQRSMLYVGTGFAIVAIFVWWYKRKFGFRRKEYTAL